MRFTRDIARSYLLTLIQEEREILELIEGGQQRFGTDSENQKTKIRLLRRIYFDLGLDD